MTTAEAWATAIGARREADDAIALESVVAHIRGAVIDAGFVSRGCITAGLKEAYRPLGVDEEQLRRRMDEALRILLQTGDLDEFATSAGRGYAATPARRVEWGSAEVAMLGGIDGHERGTQVRRIPVSVPIDDAITVSLADELGRAEWRSSLVDLGGADAPDGTPAALFEAAAALAAAGDRHTLEEPQAVAILSGRGRYFGNADETPSGRWHRVNGDGCYPARLRAAYTHRFVVMSISGGRATVWEPASPDLWRWIVIGATLAAGDPVFSYDPASARLDFHTPPPDQLERAVLLTCERVGPWSCTVAPQVHALMNRLIGSPR